MRKKSSTVISVERFRDAQKSEQKWWWQRQTKFISDEYRQYKRKASLGILNGIKAATNDGRLERVLEVGGGGDPMVEHFLGNIGVVTDPLARFYKTEIFPIQLASIEYFCGIGEHLPFKSASFDGVISYNCIDHGVAPFEILHECKRVLRQGGSMHLLVDTYSLEFMGYRKLIESTIPKYRDDLHPHVLRFNVVAKYLKKLGFVEIKDRHDEHPYFRVLRDPKKSIDRFLKDMARGHRSLRAFYRLES